ncbi:hypothetical protein L9F63_009826, partial [Diploptera punctata]
MDTDNAFSSLTPLHYLSKIFGLSLFDIFGRKKIPLFSTDLILSVLNLFLILAIELITIYKKIKIYPKMKWTLIITDTSIWISSTTTAVVCTLSAMFQSRKKITKAAQMLTQVDRLLIAKPKNFYLKIKNTLIAELAIAISFVTFIVGYHIYVWSSESINNMYLFGFYLTHIINFITNFQFCNMVQIIWYRFRIINKIISKMWNIVTDESKGRNWFILKRVNIRILDENNFNCWIDNKRKSRKELNITVYLYVALSFPTNVKANSCEGENIVHVICSSLFWALFFVIKMVLITTACSVATNESRKTPFILQSILLKQELNIDETEQVQMFCEQVMVRKLHLTACGFFDIDMSLLCSVAEAVTTYLVILVQT